MATRHLFGVERDVQLTKPQLPLAPAVPTRHDRPRSHSSGHHGHRRRKCNPERVHALAETAAFGISLINRVAGALLAGLAAVSIGIACIALPRRAATTTVAIVLIVLEWPRSAWQSGTLRASSGDVES